jgi:hypothetical protein
MSYYTSLHLLLSLASEHPRVVCIATSLRVAHCLAERLSYPFIPVPRKNPSGVLLADGFFL